MATNPFFNTTNHSGEQGLMEDLIIETIKMHGSDVYYLPRTAIKVGPVYDEDMLSRFTKNYLIEAYVQSFDSMGQLYSKFSGYEIRDRITFSMSMRRFEEEIGQAEGIRQAREGDLIYFPTTGALYEIKLVEQEFPFYQHGRLYVYSLVCEVFEYTHEQFSTGVPEVDRIEDHYSQDTEIQDDPVADDFVEEQDPAAQNEENNVDIEDFFSIGPNPLLGG